MRAPPPLSALPSANLSNASFSGSSILSPGSSQLGGSANENVTRNNTWLAFDDDLPSLLAKQVYCSFNPQKVYLGPNFSNFVHFCNTRYYKAKVKRKNAIKWLPLSTEAN